MITDPNAFSLWLRTYFMPQSMAAIGIPDAAPPASTNPPPQPTWSTIETTQKPFQNGEEDLKTLFMFENHGGEEYQIKGVGYFDRCAEKPYKFRFHAVGSLHQVVRVEEDGEEVQRLVLQESRAHAINLPYKRAWTLAFNNIRSASGSRSLSVRFEFEQGNDVRGGDLRWLEIWMPIPEAGKNHSKCMKRALKLAKLVVDSQIALQKLAVVMEEERAKQIAHEQDVFNRRFIPPALTAIDANDGTYGGVDNATTVEGFVFGGFPVADA